jgi:hypothetical protein
LIDIQSNERATVEGLYRDKLLKKANVRWRAVRAAHADRQEKQSRKGGRDTQPVWPMPPLIIKKGVRPGLIFYQAHPFSGFLISIHPKVVEVCRSYALSLQLELS